MKKPVCLILCLCLLLCGCGGSAEPQSGKVVPKETAAPTETQATEPERAASLGRIEGGEYINEYVGFGCRLDSNWTFYSAEELQTLPENIAEMMAGTEVGDAAAGLTQISDMMAENVEELATLNILYTKLTLQERLAYAALSEKAILEQILNQKDALTESYAQIGMEVTSMELISVTFLGQERWAIHTVGTSQSVPCYILQVYDCHLGQYSVVTTFTSFVEDKTSDMLDLFYPLEG